MAAVSSTSSVSSAVTDRSSDSQHAVLTEPTPELLDNVRAFLAGCFQAKMAGNDAQLRMVVQQMRVRDDEETLYYVLLSLSSFTSLLTSKSELFRELFGAIFAFDWRANRRVCEAMLGLIANLVSANAIFLSSAFQLFARSFLYDSSKDPLPDAEHTFASMHQTIRSILRAVPTGQTVLFTTLQENFPHKRFSRGVLTSYVVQLLHVCDYLPALQHRVLDLVVERSLEIDVEIIIEDSGDVRLQRDNGVAGGGAAGGDEDAYNEDIFLLEEDRLFPAPSNPAPQPLSQNCQPTTGADDIPRIPEEVEELADKLDSMLILLIQYFDEQIAKGNAASQLTAQQNAGLVFLTPEALAEANAAANAADKLYLHMLKVFESRLLTAHKSKFVQFVVFHLSARSVTFAERLARRLLCVSLDARESSTIRQAATMYLASYLSRASYLSNALIADTVSALVRWAAAYVLHNRADRVIQLNAEARQQIAAVGALAAQLQRPMGANESATVTTYKEQIMNDLKDTNLFINHVEFDDFGRLQVREHTVRQHEVFYAVVQAACYILCFHGTEMAYSVMTSWELGRTCWDLLFTSRFDPLRYVLRSVRSEFLKLALHEGLFSEVAWESFAPELLYVDGDGLPAPMPIWQHGGDSAGIDAPPGAGGASRSALGPNTLVSFFPFDPCLLCKVHAVISNCYRSWNGVPGLLDDDSVDDEGEDISMAGEHMLRSGAVSISGGDYDGMSCSVASSYMAFSEGMSLGTESLLTTSMGGGSGLQYAGWSAHIQQQSQLQLQQQQQRASEAAAAKVGELPYDDLVIQGADGVKVIPGGALPNMSAPLGSRQQSGNSVSSIAATYGSTSLLSPELLRSHEQAYLSSLDGESAEKRHRSHSDLSSVDCW